MKILSGLLVFLCLSFAFLLVCSAEITYFASDGKEVSAEEYDKIARDWQGNVSETNTSRLNEAAQAGDETGSIAADDGGLPDPAFVRQKRLEQWKKYRKMHSG